MHEIWYDYAKPKYEKNKQNYVISIHSPTKRGKKFYWINDRWIRWKNHELICEINSEKIKIFNRQQPWK